MDLHWRSNTSQIQTMGVSKSSGWGRVLTPPPSSAPMLPENLSFDIVIQQPRAIPRSE